LVEEQVEIVVGRVAASKNVIEVAVGGVLVVIVV
jgi:hypothetical protein